MPVPQPEHPVPRPSAQLLKAGRPRVTGGTPPATRPAHAGGRKRCRQVAAVLTEWQCAGATLQHALEAIGRLDRDIAWALRSFAGAHPWLTAPVIVVTAVAISGSAASVVLLCRVRPRLRGPVAAASAAVLAYAGSDAADAAWYRPRPFAEMHVRPLYPHPANSSFPSGTVAVVAAVATVAFFAWPALGRVLAAATAMVAFGCVYVGVHYASDVTAGAVVGAAVAALTWQVSGQGWASTLLTAADRLGARIRRPGQDPAVR